MTLKAAARLWFVMAVIGQWAFLYYVAAFYGRTTVQGNFQAWSKNDFLFKGYVPGDTAGNLTFAAHTLLAGIIAFGGAIQLVPGIRQRAMFLHRWNGRLFLVTAFGVSLSGLYMLWVRGANGPRLGMPHAIAISLDALLIMVFGTLAWRSALQRDPAGHRRWALRTFMAANAQWFFRVGFVAWAILARGRVDGAFVHLWDFGSYLLPLAVLELYLRAKESAAPNWRLAMACGLVALTLLMAFGSAGFTAFVWQRLLTKA